MSWLRTEPRKAGERGARCAPTTR